MILRKRNLKTLSALKIMALQPLFRFGVIADIQYADIEDASNFGKTETRYYRKTVQEAAKAVEFWNQQADPPIKFVAQLGDLIDGQNAAKYGQGLKFDEPQTEKAFETVMEVLERANKSIKYHHAIGNHELYNFDWSTLSTKLNVPERHMASVENRFYYSFKPHPGWNVIMLNPYEVSVLQSEESEGFKKAKDILVKNNPNDCIYSQNVNYFDGLKGDSLRFVPFNGGLGEIQLKWLREEVSQSSANGEKIIVLSHLPMHKKSASPRNLAFDAPEVLEIFENEGKGSVVLFLAGHAHRGGFFSCDDTDIHHITVHSPLSNGESHGCVEVYHDRIEIVGKGAFPSRTLPI